MATVAIHMDRESKRTYIARGSALTVTVVVHGLIIIYALSSDVITVPSAAPAEAILITLIDKPRRPNM
jgi:hypothetical protein